MHKWAAIGPAYYKRSPEAVKKFKPECTNNALQECSRTGLVNAYDNSLAYTDYFLQVLAYLKNKHPNAQAAMLYVADHGESLGRKQHLPARSTLCHCTGCPKARSLDQLAFQ